MGHYSKIIIVASIISIVIVSGCVSQGPGFWDQLFGPAASIFGLDVVKTTREVQSIGVVNPLSITSVKTLPENKVLPQANVQLFMEIANTDNDPSKTINTIVDIFDAGVFKTKDGTKNCNEFSPPKTADTCGPTDGRGTSICQSGSECNLRLGATKQITFEMKAPTAEEIANVITKSKLNYKVQYSYIGGTNFEVLVVDYNEIIARQKSGSALSQKVSDIKGSGPVKIDITSGAPYVITSAPLSATTSKAFLIFTIRNAGSGFLKDSQIEDNQMTIKIPKELAGNEQNIDYDKSAFGCIDGDADITCTNSDKIKLFKSDSVPFQFIINNVPALPEGAPHRTYLVRAVVSYTYELRSYSELEVNPIIRG